jgi:pSer/pThr/pTyr-binding forkhead associated (FHA) protein
MTIPFWMLLARIGLMVCLYGFLTTMLVFLWQDLRNPHTTSRQSIPTPAQLHWLEAASGHQATFLLTGDSARIGRSLSAEVHIADDTVSVLHARIWFQDGRWWLEDLGSKNSTYLNEIPLDQSAVLCDGDRIRLGRCQMEFLLKA